MDKKKEVSQFTMKDKENYTKALLGGEDKEGDTSSLVLAIQGAILIFSLFWELRKLCKQDKKESR